MNNYNYNDVLSKGKLDINSKQIFGYLKEKEEILLTRELINYCFWVNNNLDWLEKHLLKKNVKLKDNNGFLNYSIIAEFWMQEIGKNDQIEELLKQMNVISDIYDYIEQYYNKFKYVFINSKRDFGMILKNNYRTSEQAKTLKELIKLNDKKSQKIKNFFKKHNKDIHHIDKKNAEILINL